MNTRIFNFNQIYGNGQIKNTVISFLASGRFPNFQIFSGAPGLGKSTLAETIGLALTCSGRGHDYNPCCKCDHCIAGLSAILEGGGSSNLKKFNMANIKPADLSKVISSIFDLDYGQENVVFILEEFHVLSSNLQEAFNEEIDKLPPNVFVFLCTSKISSIIQPLQSRSAWPFQLKPLNNHEAELLFNSVVGRLQLAGSIPVELRKQILDYAKGQPRKITLILKELKDNPNVNYETLMGLFSTVSYDDLRNLLRSHLKMNEFLKLAEELVSTYSAYDLVKALKEFLMEYVFLASGLSHRDTFLASPLDEAFATELGHRGCLELYKIAASINGRSSQEDILFAFLLMGEFLDKQSQKLLAGQGVANQNSSQAVVKRASTARQKTVEESTSFKKELSQRDLLAACREARKR